MAETIFEKTYTVETFKSLVGVKNLPFYKKKDSEGNFKFYVDPTTKEETDVPVLLSWVAVTEEFKSKHPEIPVVETKDNNLLVVVRMSLAVATDVAAKGKPSNERPLQISKVKQESGYLLSLNYAPMPEFMA